MLPVFSVLIVLFPLLRITQHLIGLVDLLEFFVRFLVVRVEVRMVLPRQFPVCGPDLILGRGLAHPQYFIIIYKIHELAFFTKVVNLLAQFFYPDLKSSYYEKILLFNVSNGVNGDCRPGIVRMRWFRGTD